VTRHGCRRGKDSEGWCVTRKARRRAEGPPPRPTEAGNPADGKQTSALDSSRVEDDRPSADRGTRPAEGSWSREAEDSKFVTWTGRDGGNTRSTEPETSRHAVEVPWRGCSHCVAVGRKSNAKPETWRTPWLAAGCNRPARHCAEQTVVAGKNGKGGTSSGPGGPEPKEPVTRSRVRGSGSGRAVLMSTEGRSLDNPKRGVRTVAMPVFGTPRGCVLLECRGRTDSSDSSSPKERTRPEDRAKGRDFAPAARRTGMEP